MKRLLLTLLTIPVLAIITHAQQCRTEVKFSPTGQPTGIYNIMSDYQSYGNAKLTGRIVKVNYNPENEIDIVGFVIELSNGIRESVGVTHDECLSTLSNLEKKWVPYVIRKGKRVRIDAKIAGSGGFIEARNIILLGTASTTKKNR